MFDINPHHPVFVGTYVPPDATISDTVEDGDSVTLKIEDEDVEVVNISQTGNDEFKGIVSGFGPGHLTTFRDLEIDQEVTFKLENVFGCTKGSRG